MPAKTALTGYSRLQIALHWVALAVIAHQDLFNDAMSAAWDCVTDGLEAGFDPRVLAHVAGGALVMILMPVSGAVVWSGGVEVAAQGHHVMKIILLALVALHLVGALCHMQRHGTLARMRHAQG
jgi:cytochrome b561